MSAKNLNPNRFMKYLFSVFSIPIVSLGLIVSVWAQADDPLPSWEDGASKAAIVEFVEAVTQEGGEDYVPPAERVATFDNDGTLWVEYPIYTQFQFALARVKELAPEHPEWRTTQPFKAVLDGDLKAVAASGKKGLLEILAATH